MYINMNSNPVCDLENPKQRRKNERDEGNDKGGTCLDLDQI